MREKRSGDRESSHTSVHFPTAHDGWDQAKADTRSQGLNLISHLSNDAPTTCAITCCPSPEGNHQQEVRMRKQSQD